jgi:hypothetical protein
MAYDILNLNRITLDLHEAITDAGGVECEKVPNLFFPEDIKPKNDFKTKMLAEQTAREICLRCPVMAKCLKVGLYEDFGIWGGTTPAQRRILKRQQEI